jgi:hypothetical protein
MVINMNESLNNYIKIILISIVMLFLPINVNAQEIATCKNLEGYSYYHFSGVVPKNKSGWNDDKITGGVTTLTKNANGEYDILILDASKTIKSLTQEGGKVILIRKGVKDASFIHLYPGMVAEVYTFWTTTDGKNKLDMLRSKGGNGVLVHLSSLMIGECGNIDFEMIN